MIACVLAQNSFECHVFISWLLAVLLASNTICTTHHLQAWLHDAVALSYFNPIPFGAAALSLQDQSLSPLETERVFKTLVGGTIFPLYGIQNGSIA